jgi:hypothetical protein
MHFQRQLLCFRLEIKTKVALSLPYPGTTTYYFKPSMISVVVSSVAHLNKSFDLGPHQEELESFNISVLQWSMVEINFKHNSVLFCMRVGRYSKSSY